METDRDLVRTASEPVQSLWSICVSYWRIVNAIYACNFICVLDSVPFYRYNDTYLYCIEAKAFSMNHFWAIETFVEHSWIIFKKY